tara:strand:+ start:39314 stop:41155 length:1842 start_codon:yes stop_codon:yes gene_type:complete
MKKITFCWAFILFLSYTSNIFAQADSLTNSSVLNNSDSLFLNITIPETDTVTYNFSRYRVAAHTNPKAKAYVNGKELKVYESGAFIDLVEHLSDTTKIVFSVGLNGEVLTKEMLLIRSVDEPLDVTGKVISDRMMKPESELWLKSGEILEVQFQGTPGEKVVFNIDNFKENIPMHEVPEDVAGIKGFYKGFYIVKPGDVVEKRYITFKMKKGFLGYKKKKSAYPVSFIGMSRVAIVTADDAYLNIGMGTDRLGGAKYGNIEKGVFLTIDGLKNDTYRVRLTENLSAWIPARFVELQDKSISSVSSLTGNIRVSGRGDSDVITVSLSEKLPYISTQEIHPNKIIVDIFGATSNTNWKIKHKSSLGIKDITWEQIENDRFRIEIELNHSQNWGYSVGYGWGSQLNISVKRPPVIQDVINPIKGRIIAVDAGHGGTNNGSLGAAGNLEKVITLQIATRLKNLLESNGAEVIMLRADDSYVYMSDRREQTLKAKADLLVSIHTNSIGYSSDALSIRGTGSFYKHIAFKPLAEIMYDKMLELGLKDYGLTGSFNFSLNAPIEFPNVLVETAFLSNPEEEILLTNPEFQDRITEQITEGLKEFYLKHSSIESVSDMPDH